MKIFKKLLFIGSLTAPLFFSGHFQETVAEKFFKNFPEEISGAKTIEKYNIPGAKYCLVHIRQYHLGEKLTKQELDEIDYIQKNIYQILNYLIENKNLKSVRVEGLYLRKKPKPNELEEAITKNYCKNYFETEKEYVGGGDAKLVSEGKIKPESTEYLEQRIKESKKAEEMKGYNNWKKNDLISYTKYVLDEREDILLEIISKDNDVKNLLNWTLASYRWDSEL